MASIAMLVYQMVRHLESGISSRAEFHCGDPGQWSGGCERFGGRWSHRQRIWQGCLESIPRDAAVLYRLDNLVLVYYLYLFFPCSWWVLARYVWIRWSGHYELGISPRSISIHIWVQFDFIGCYMAMIIGLCLFQLRSGMQWYQHNYYYIYDSMLLICS